jgi:peptide/nickel transport system permease protein
MMGIQIVILWSDLLIWLLVAAGIGVGLLIARDPPFWPGLPSSATR